MTPNRPNKSANPYLIIGKIGASYGTHGWLKVYAYTEFNENIFDYQPWYIQQQKTVMPAKAAGIQGGVKEEKWRAFQIEESKPHGKGTIVRLAGIQTPEQAHLLTGSLIAITRSQLPKLKENEYYWSDLIGLTVINKNGSILGKVIYLMETGSNDVLIVKGEKEIAVPYLLGSVIHNIDLEKQVILVDWEPV